MIRLVAGLALLAGTAFPLEAAFGQTQPGGVVRLGMRLSNSIVSTRNVAGVMYALDGSGKPISDLSTAPLQAAVDDKPVNLSLVPGRPSIALAAGFLLDSSATPQVRDAVTNALADGVQSIDVNRDTVAIASTTITAAWEQAAFTTSADDLKKSLNQIIQTEPQDSAATLEQVSGMLRGLSAQQRDTRVLLLFVNRPLASAATVNASLGTIRGYASDNGIQVSIIALPGAGGQGPAEALAEATPGGRVEYVLNATNRQDISRRIGLLLAPDFGSQRFEFPTPSEGSHTLTVGVSGLALQATAPFQVTGRSVEVDSLQTSAGPLLPGAQIGQPTWVEVKPAENATIDSVEWTLDGRVTQVTADPWALLIDPEQLADGPHEVSARIISQGHAGPFLTSSVSITPDFLRTVRHLVRAWGLIAVLLIAEVVVIVLFVRVAPAARGAVAKITEFPPTLRLNPLAGTYVAPELIEFPSRGKLRIGYHPPYMDNQVGNRDFAKLPYQDIRGDEEAVKDLSRHAACIWRDPKTNDCFIQLGWPGPGDPLKPKVQSQVFHFGRPQDATLRPFRLAHHDVVRLGSGVEFVFNQVGLRDKATPESKKLSPFEVRGGAPGRVAVLQDVTRRQPVSQETLAEEG
jgi:hypothetical protein